MRETTSLPIIVAMNEGHQPRRRWFRFSLRTLFVVVTVFAVWLGWNARQVRQRERMLQSYGVLFYGNAPSVNSQKKLPFLWSVLGAKYIGTIQLPPDEFTNDDLRRFQVAFPEADVRRLPLFDQRQPLVVPSK